MANRKKATKRKETRREFEDRVLNAQISWIEKHYGTEAAGDANYGWGIGGDDETVSIATKVYGHGTLTSGGKLGGRVFHTFDEY